LQSPKQFATLTEEYLAGAQQTRGKCGVAQYEGKAVFGGDPNTAATENDARLRPIILAVGDVRNWISKGRALPMDSQIAFAEFHEITPELLQTLTPDIVMSPVLTRGFDCLDLAQALHDGGFRGRLRVVAPDMPNPLVIQSEIKALCPGLDVAFIYYDASAVHHLH
jgi:hypothetical protein